MKSFQRLVLFFGVLAAFGVGNVYPEIRVPQGFVVSQIARINPAPDVQTLAFDEESNIIAGSALMMMLKIAPSGSVDILAQTRRLDFGPTALIKAPDGTFTLLVQKLLVSGIPSTQTRKIVRYVPPDSFETLLPAGHNYSSIAYDNLGNFYASYYDPAPDRGMIVRYDSGFNPAEIIRSGMANSAGCLKFDLNNNLYFTGGQGIYRIPAGSDGIPGSGDPTEFVIQNPGGFGNLAFDSSGNLFATVLGATVIDGYVTRRLSDLIKIDDASGTYEIFAADIETPMGLVHHQGNFYVGELGRGIVLKIDSSGGKRDFTRDFGAPQLQAAVLDGEDRVYTIDFRLGKFLQILEDGTPLQIGPSVYVPCTLVENGGSLYFGAIDAAGNLGSMIFRMDPQTQNPVPILTKLPDWRYFSFDAYGRLILKTSYTAFSSQLKIIDVSTGTAVSYITGVHPYVRDFSFDSRQNLYVVEGLGRGIKKIALEKDYSPPRDVGGEPLFYDFSSQPWPPSINKFAVNDREEVYIPQMETGQILMGDGSGGLKMFAEGFRSPWTVSLDRYHRLYVVDQTNGIYRISGAAWSAPILTGDLNALIADIESCGVQEGLKNSLTAKLKNVVKSLENLKIHPAIQMIEAFRNEVAAQYGQKIPAETADLWLKRSDRILAVLQELNL